MKPSEMLDLFIENNFDVLPVHKNVDLCGIQSEVAQLEEENEALDNERISLCVLLKEWLALIHPQRLDDLRHDTIQILDHNRGGG